MAILVKNQIMKRIKEGGLSFSPGLDEFQLQSHSIDLRLGYTFMVPKVSHVTAAGRQALSLDYLSQDRPKYFEVIELERGQHFEILPHEHILVSTLETVKLPNDLMAVLYPRSSTNRKGLSVDLSGIVDAGYEGQLIIPVRNNTGGQVVKLYPGERFCQLVFEELAESVEPKLSRYHKKDVIAGVIGEGSSPENELIAKGDIEELKKRFPLSENPL